MKIQCDVCEKAPATVICCADEAALCSKCDIQVHAANKLASKHQRLLLNCLDNKLPPCDICQEKTAFIFCVEDRALFCRDCDAPIHSASSHAANHQRFLATGIRVALSSSCTKERENTIEDLNPPKNAQRVSAQVHTNEVPSFSSSPWAVDDLLQFSEPEPCDKVQKDQQLEFGELDWFTDMGLFGDQAPAEVPQLPILSQLSNSTKFGMPMNSYRSNKLGMPNKKPRIETTEDDDEFFTVPDLG